MAERLYQMTRLRAGDYLLPSNDAKTLWRIYAYEEDGGAERTDGSKVVGTYWALSRRPFPTPADPLDPDDWDAWQFWAGPLPTRGAAVAEAMRAQPG